MQHVTVTFNTSLKPLIDSPVMRDDMFFRGVGRQFHPGIMTLHSMSNGHLPRSMRQAPEKEKFTPEWWRNNVVKGLISNWSHYRPEREGAAALISPVALPERIEQMAQALLNAMLMNTYRVMMRTDFQNTERRLPHLVTATVVIGRNLANNAWVVAVVAFPWEQHMLCSTASWACYDTTDVGPALPPLDPRSIAAATLGEGKEQGFATLLVEMVLPNWTPTYLNPMNRQRRTSYFDSGMMKTLLNYINKHVVIIRRNSMLPDTLENHATRVERFLSFNLTCNAAHHLLSSNYPSLERDDFLDFESDHPSGSETGFLYRVTAMVGKVWSVDDLSYQHVVTQEGHEIVDGNTVFNLAVVDTYRIGKDEHELRYGARVTVKGVGHA